MKCFFCKPRVEFCFMFCQRGLRRIELSPSKWAVTSMRRQFYVARTRRFYLKFEPDLDGKPLSSIFHVLLFKVSLTFESGSELKSTAYNARSNFPLVLFFFFTILRNEIWDVSISKSGMAEMKELNCSNEPCWALLRWSIVGFFDFSPKWPLFWKSVVFVIC